MTQRDGGEKLRLVAEQQGQRLPEERPGEVIGSATVAVETPALWDRIVGQLSRTAVGV